VDSFLAALQNYNLCKALHVLNMDSAIFITTLIITVILCSVSLLFIKNKFKNKTISKSHAYLYFSISCILATTFSGIFLVSFFNTLAMKFGYTVDFGHVGEALIAIWHFIIMLILIPVGFVIMNWKKIDY